MHACGRTSACAFISRYAYTTCTYSHCICMNTLAPRCGGDDIWMNAAWMQWQVATKFKLNNRCHLSLFSRAMCVSLNILSLPRTLKKIKVPHFLLSYYNVYLQKSYDFFPFHFDLWPYKHVPNYFSFLFSDGLNLALSCLIWLRTRIVY